MDYKQLYERLFEVSKQAGELALNMQKDIVNEGKQIDYIIGESERHRAMRAAKTKADELVQDLFLMALWEYRKEISLDVEEDSELVKAYGNTSYEISFILDPIDGTLEYLEQKDSYSICSAIIEEGDVKLAIVFFPAQNILYGYYEGMQPKVYQNAFHAQASEGNKIVAERKKPFPKRIYKNDRLASEQVTKLRLQGYEVVDDNEGDLNCPKALLECLRGEGLACFCDTRNLRDILLGAILAKTDLGNAYDYTGKALVWEKKGRQKEAIFTLYGNAWIV